MLPGKLKYPKFLETIPCKITALGKKTDDAGQPLENQEWRGHCIWSESGKQIMTADQRVVNLSGIAVLSGESAPFFSGFSGGHITMYPGGMKERTLMIHTVKHPRNPDGTIHHTSLELI